MGPFNLKSFKKKMMLNRPILRRFLTRLENNQPRGLDKVQHQENAEVWKDMDCLACANCCKTMSPTFTTEDVKRISKHVGMSVQAFRSKYLYLDKADNDWMNKQQPCQFLNLTDNKCSIYEVRPSDCAGFPHHIKKKVVDYMHVYKQNVEYCPATYKLVERMMYRLEGEKPA
jgi:Fe-S-cluster containining protein